MIAAGLFAALMLTACASDETVTQVKKDAEKRGFTVLSDESSLLFGDVEVPIAGNPTETTFVTVDNLRSNPTFTHCFTVTASPSAS